MVCYYKHHCTTKNRLAKRKLLIFLALQLVKSEYGFAALLKNHSHRPIPAPMSHRLPLHPATVVWRDCGQVQAIRSNWPWACQKGTFPKCAKRLSTLAQHGHGASPRCHQVG